MSVRVRFSDQQVVSRSTTLNAPIATTAALAQIAEHLVDVAINEAAEGRGLSLIGISISKLVVSPHLQLELPFELDGEARRPGTEKGAARWVLDRSVDKVREKFGRELVGYGSVALGDRRSVPDAFRELAEKEL